jgi:hypothetical protein
MTGWTRHWPTHLGGPKLNSLDPERYLRQVLERIADHPIQHISELLPWNISLPTQTHTHSYKCSKGTHGRLRFSVEVRPRGN